ncbi:MAG TPA: hypothetical protein VGB78_03045 [Thermoplasmata archaeon]
MAGNYLKSLQLTKQLEERAKEAGKNRELAEREYEDLEEFLKQCKEADSDLSEVEKPKRDFEGSMATKDYQAALGHVRQAREAARNSYLRKIGEVADSVEGLINLMGSDHEEATSAVEMLEKSKERVMNEDLEGGMKLARNAYNTAEKGLHQYFSELFSQAQDVIMQAKDMGNDVGLFEDQLLRAKSALENQEFEACASQIEEVLEAAGEDIKMQINSAISRAEELLSAGEEFGSDMTKVKNHIDRAKSNLDSLRFKDALAYAKRAEGEGENSISAKLQELVRDTRDNIKKLKSAEMDIAVPQQLLDQAQNALKEKKYIEAVHALNTARERAHKTQFQSVLDVIAVARDRFVLAKKVGVDMSKSIALLNTSRDHLKLGKFQEAMDYAEQSRKEVDSALEEFYKARDDIVELAKAAKFAADMGADATKTKEMLAGARKSFEAKDYNGTIELTKKGIADAKKLAYDQTMASIDAADKAVKLGKTTGADVTEAEGTLHKALDYLSKEDLVESMNLSKASQEASRAAMTRVMSDRLQSIDTFVKSYSSQEGLAEIQAMIQEARQNISSFDFEKASLSIKQVTQTLESIGKTECDRIIGEASSKIESVRTMGGDFSDIEILMTRAKEAYDRRVYEDATARAREIIQSADETITRIVHAEFSAVKDTLEEAKTIGIDIGDAKTSLKEARIKVESHEFVDAYRLVKDTNSGLQRQIERYDAIKAKVRRAEELISEAGRVKVDVSGVLKALDKGRNAFSDGDLDGAESSLDRCIQDTEKNLGMYLAAKLILTSKEQIDLGQSQGIEMDRASKLLAKAKEQMKRKQYDDALATVKECDETSRSTISSSVAEMIRELQRLLTDARNVGVDTAGPEKLAEQASALVRSRSYTEALRCISSAKEDINHIKNLSSQAALEIRVARNSLKDAETLDVNVGRARDFLEQAVEALTRHQYAIALELARKSSEISSEVTRARIWGTLERFKERVDKAATEGVATGMAERCISDGLKAFKEGRYQESLKLTLACETEMERAELQRDISARAVELARKKLAEANSEGIRSEHLSELVKRSEELLRSGKYVDALTTAIDGGDELHAIRENIEGCRTEMSSLKERIDRLKKIKIDTSECDELIDMAQEELASQDFARCRETLVRASEAAEHLIESSITDVMEQNKSMIAKANAMGINTKSCEDLLEVANTSFKEKLWDFAYQQAMTCRNNCYELISKKMTRLIDEVQNKVADLKIIGASTSSVEELLASAREADASGEARDAFQIVMQADARLGSIEDSHEKFVDISIAAESAMDSLARFGLPRKEPERLLAMADIEKEKDYDSAIELVAEALDTAKTIMETYSPDIGGSISAVGLQEGVAGELAIAIKNSGKAMAKEVFMKLSGDFETALAPKVSNLKPGGEEIVKAMITPRGSGSLPIKVELSTRRHFDEKVQTFEIEDAVNVFAAGPPFKIGRATDQNRCISCQGRIKPGFDILMCRCGGQLHLLCAKRNAQCPICNQKYSF